MKISVVMTSYNYEKYIAEAIESVINQTYSDWELIIVDDGSKDNSVNIIKEFLNKDNRIKLLVNSKNFGLAKSIQKALSIVQGDWIAFLESDDKWHPDTLQEKLEVADKYGVDFVFSDVELSNHCDRLDKHFNTVNSLYLDREKSCFIDNFKEIIPHANIIPTFSVVFLKKELLKACNFNTFCTSHLDYYLWAQLSKAKVYYINKKLTYWRIHDDSYINRMEYTELTKLLYRASIVFYTSNGNFLYKFFRMLNYIRQYFITLKISNRGIRFVFFANGEKLGFSI